MEALWHRAAMWIDGRGHLTGHELRVSEGRGDALTPASCLAEQVQLASCLPVAGVHKPPRFRLPETGTFSSVSFRDHIVVNQEWGMQTDTLVIIEIESKKTSKQKPNSKLKI